jgi:aldose 1-epimerase
METTKQMYQVKREPFGTLEQVRIGNGESELIFIPGNGSYITDLKFKLGDTTFSIVDGYNDYTSLMNRDYYKSAFLLPFPNRLKDGKYSYKGKTYQFPINDSDGNNALHGFDDFYKMELKDVQLKGENASVILHNSYNGQNPSYPFAFEFTVTYILGEDNSFECEIQIRNPNDFTIPIGFGWHPYFQIGEFAKNLKLQLPACEKVEVDAGMIPTGKVLDYTKFSESKLLDDTSLDTCFKLKEKKGNATICLVSEEHNVQLTYWQEAKQFPYFQIYTPPTGKSVAIEPMTCNINAFNSGDRLMEMPAKAVFSGKFGVKLEEI